LSRRLALAAILCVAGCAAAMHEPRSLDPAGPTTRPREDVDRLLVEAQAAFDRRPEPEAVREAEALFTDAALADPSRIEGLLGMARVAVFRVEHEDDPGARKAEVDRALQAAQLCGRSAGADSRCDYWLALALGLQARERPSTAHDAVGRMVESLRRVIARDPDLDQASPHRVLALVLLRAPGWPLGPGDGEAGLAEAREAAARFPDHPPNQLVLAEALRKNGRTDEAHAAYLRARDGARARMAEGDRDAAEWEEEAARALERP
jgi:hypothetical protein